jgi:hypothetical protein
LFMEAFCKGIQHLVQLKDVSRKIGEKRNQNSELRSQDLLAIGSRPSKMIYPFSRNEEGYGCLTPVLPRIVGRGAGV